jgi:phage antirepressor YoqD-like protein
MDKEEILQYYETHSFEDTAKFFKVGKKKLNDYFEEFNISKKLKGGQKILIKKYDVNERYNYFKDQITESVRIKNICKLTGTIFYDWFNEGGFLSSHLRKLNIVIPSHNERKKYQMEFGVLWWEQHFDYVIEHIKTVKCKICDWSTIDVNNKTGALQKHITETHNITMDEYLNNNPDEIDYYKSIIKNNNRNEHLSKTDNSVICKVCNKKLKSITNTHLLTHNMSIMDYRVKYPNDKLISVEKFNQYKNQFKNVSFKIKKSFKSVNEVDVANFLISNGIKVIQTYRKINGMEIDIYLPDYNIGIEYNGLYWHSEEYGKNKMYHLNKTIKCSENGVKLIHIFEDEWVNKKNITKKKLLHILNLDSSIRIHARKCIIRPIDVKIKNIFLNDNHIQGEDRSNYYIGAFYNDELVSVMCFNSKRNMTRNVDGQWELTRFATKYNICGISNRLLKYFINNKQPKTVISFADRRWTINYDNNLYTNLGFKLISITEPNYTYFNPKIERCGRLHKFNFGKKKLLSKYPNIDPNKSEWDIMSNLGYKKIWDCGLLKYEFIPIYS